MALTSSTDRVFEANDTEYGYLLKEMEPPDAGGTLLLNVPKIVGMLNATSGILNVNGNSMFDNASDCKINYSKTLKLGAGIEAVVRDNQIWKDKLNSQGRIPRGTMFAVEFIDGAVQHAYVTSK